MANEGNSRETTSTEAEAKDVLDMMSSSIIKENYYQIKDAEEEESLRERVAVAYYKRVRCGKYSDPNPTFNGKARFMESNKTGSLQHAIYVVDKLPYEIVKELDWLYNSVENARLERSENQGYRSAMRDTLNAINGH